MSANPPSRNRSGSVLPAILGRRLPTGILLGLELILMLGLATAAFSLHADNHRPATRADIPAIQDARTQAPMRILGHCRIGDPIKELSVLWQGASVREADRPAAGGKFVWVTWAGPRHIARLEFHHKLLTSAQEYLTVRGADGKTREVCQVLDSANRSLPSEMVVVHAAPKEIAPTPENTIFSVAFELGPSEN